MIAGDWNPAELPPSPMDAPVDLSAIRAELEATGAVDRETALELRRLSEEERERAIAAAVVARRNLAEQEAEVTRPLTPDEQVAYRAIVEAARDRLGLATLAETLDVIDPLSDGHTSIVMPTGPAPFPEPEDRGLVEVLARVEQFMRRYVVFPRPETVVAVVLWVAHTYAIELADATPYLAISSPEKQSGKTRLLECLQLLAHGCSGIAITPTAATIYRSLEASPGATLLLDELDAVFRDRSDKYEEVRAVINAGHRRGATVPRSVPGPKSTWLVKQFPVFGPKALAGIGKLPDTVTDRAIPVRMLKRKRSEPVEKFRVRTATGEAASIVAGLVAALAARPPAFDADLPPELPDRAADAWEPLLAIADAAGGAWPARARGAAVVLHASREQDDSLGLRLLSDIRLVFDARAVERIFTADLITALQADEEGPWVSDRSPLTPHRLAKLLHPFEIGSKQVRIGPTSLKGHERLAFVDAWERYLPNPPSPLDPKHRNSEHDRSFDVSYRAPSDGDASAEPADRPIEEDYPRSAWDPDVDEDPDADEDDPQFDQWVKASVPAPDAGRAT
jgi:hypothetical protein